MLCNNNNNNFGFLLLHHLLLIFISFLNHLPHVRIVLTYFRTPQKYFPLCHLKLKSSHLKILFVHNLLFIPCTLVENYARTSNLHINSIITVSLLLLAYSFLHEKKQNSHVLLTWNHTLYNAQLNYLHILQFCETLQSYCTLQTVLHTY